MSRMPETLLDVVLRYWVNEAFLVNLGGPHKELVLSGRMPTTAGTSICPASGTLTALGADLRF